MLSIRILLFLVLVVYSHSFIVNMQETALPPRKFIPYNTNVPPKLLKHCVYHSYNNARLTSLESLVSELCNALVDCDDLKLLERDAAKIGPVYLDTGFVMQRNPLLLRSRLKQIIQKYHVHDVSIQRTWNVCNTSLA